MIYYLSQWFPAEQRARAISRFMIAIPLSSVLGGPLGGWLLGMDGRFGLRGWQWLFLIEGIPSFLLSGAVLAFLTDRIDDAHWLGTEQRAWLAASIAGSGKNTPAPRGMPPIQGLVHPVVWLIGLTFFLLNTAAYSYIFWAPSIQIPPIEALA